MTRMTLNIASRLIWLASICYLSSLFLPTAVYSLAADSPRAIHIQQHYDWIGFDFLIDGGIEFLSHMNDGAAVMPYVPWLANPIFLAAITLSACKWYKIAFTMSMASFSLGLFFLIQSHEYPGGARITLQGMGYPVWLLSFFFLCIHCLPNRAIQATSRND